MLKHPPVTVEYNATFEAECQTQNIDSFLDFGAATGTAMHMKTWQSGLEFHSFF